MRTRAATIRGVFWLALVLALAGCDTMEVDCLDFAAPAMSVTVVTSDTGVPVGGALAIARDGSFADSMRSRVVEGDPRPASLAFERPGTYEVTVEKEAFNTWSRSGVEVTEGECHVNTVELTARLVPLSR